MKTAPSIRSAHRYSYRFPEDNLWQWADEKRSARLRQETAPESLSRRMARGILARFHLLLEK